MDPSDPMYTFNDPHLTYHYDKISCMRGAYFAHIVFAYLIFLTGIAAFVSRLVPAVKWTHAWFGRAYIISMLWATATSLIIHNSGLPAATLISFVWSLGGLTIAWVLIKLHESRIQRQALSNVQRQIAATGIQGDLEHLINAEKGKIAANQTFLQRFFSIKALHGIIMFVSWINIAGRIFATRLDSDFTCHTYPVYKAFDSPDPDKLVLLPIHNPEYYRQPWARLGLTGWGAVMLIGPFFGAALVGAVFSLLEARMAKKRQNGAAGKAGAKVLAVGP